MGTDTQNTMLDLLDQAYHVTDDVDQFDALLQQADQYVAGQQHGIAAQDFLRLADLDPHLENHIDRLKKLMLRRDDEEKLGLSIEQHAQFVLAKNGRILTSNAQAQKLFAGVETGFVGDLPIRHNGLSALREILREINAGVQKLERILYLQIDTDDVYSAFGYCKAIAMEHGETALHISLSYFDWSPAIFNSLQMALDITESESAVLQGILMGKTYAEIAEMRGRSVDTVKTQARSVLRKSECGKMADLVHLCTSIAYVVGLSDAQPLDAPETGWVTPRQGVHMIPLPEKRNLAYYEYGDPNGRPVLFIHGLLQGPFFLDRMNKGFLERGLRVIAPSRPGYGYTSPPVDNDTFNAIVCDDMQALIRHLDIADRFLIVAHHGGAVHAFRFANHLQEGTISPVSGMVMIGARFPMNSEYISHLKTETRMVARAAEHAPSVLRMMAMLCIKVYRKKGAEEFVNKVYGLTPFDLKCMRDPERSAKLCQGIYHLSQQNTEAIASDFRAQTQNWLADFEAGQCRQHWLYGRNGHVPAAKSLEKFASAYTDHPVEVLDDAGFNILFQAPERVLAVIEQAVGWN